MVPGEMEYKTKEKREKEGIPVSEEIWTHIMDTANELKVDLEKETP
jgi:LDH2 family malate/lactate/ureidoglycolate dehydrogenase